MMKWMLGFLLLLSTISHAQLSGGGLMDYYGNPIGPATFFNSVDYLPVVPLSGNYFHPIYTTRIQSVAVVNTLASATLTATLTATQAGSLIVVNAGRKTSTLTITDSASQTYTQITNLTSGTDNNYFFYKPDTAAGVTSVTISCPIGTDSLILIVSEYANLTTTPLDKSAGLVNAGVTAWTSGLTSATTQATELLIGTSMAVLHVATTFVAGTGWTAVNSISNTIGAANLVAYTQEQYVNMTGTYASTGTTSGNDNILASIGTFLTTGLPSNFTVVNSPTLIKSGPGTLSKVIINNVGSGSAEVTLYDNTTNSGTVIAVINLTTSMITLDYNLHFSTGLTMVVNSSSADFTIVYN